MHSHTDENGWLQKNQNGLSEDSISVNNYVSLETACGTNESSKAGIHALPKEREESG